MPTYGRTKPSCTGMRHLSQLQKAGSCASHPPWTWRIMCSPLLPLICLIRETGSSQIQKSLRRRPHRQLLHRPPPIVAVVLSAAFCQVGITKGISPGLISFLTLTPPEPCSQPSPGSNPTRPIVILGLVQNASQQPRSPPPSALSSPVHFSTCAPVRLAWLGKRAAISWLSRDLLLFPKALLVGFS